jgi:hypothetical protein
MARWLQNAPADVRRVETPFTPEPLPDLLVFHQRPLPAGAVTDAQLTENWIAAANRQLADTPIATRWRALLHALGFGASSSPRAPSASARRAVVVAGIEPSLQQAMQHAGFAVKAVDFTPFDVQEAAKIPHFDTYNRTEAGQRVADIVEALRGAPGAALVASGDAALAGLLALAVEHGRRAVLDVGAFDTASDAAFVEHLYIPGLRRAGDLSTAAALAGNRTVIHNASEQFRLSGVSVRREKLQARDIIALLRER